MAVFPVVRRCYDSLGARSMDKVMDTAPVQSEATVRPFESGWAVQIVPDLVVEWALRPHYLLSAACLGRRLAGASDNI